MEEQLQLRVPRPARRRITAALARFAATRIWGGLNRLERGPGSGGPEQYRFYWNTPIIMSPHNPSILYVGGDRFFKSLNRGDT